MPVNAPMVGSIIYQDGFNTGHAFGMRKTISNDDPRIEFWAVTGYAFGIGIADNVQYFILLNISINSQCNQFPDPKGGQM